MIESEILDAYWPVIEKCIEIQVYYAGKADQKYYKNGEPAQLICPDITGEMIEALIKARKSHPIKQVKVLEMENADTDN